MKRNYIAKLFVVLFLVTGIASCGRNDNNPLAAHQHDESGNEYTCPMHPQVLQSEQGTCPICKMDLVLKTGASAHTGVDTSLDYLLKPVDEQVVSSLPTTKVTSGSKIHTEKVQGRITYDTRNQTSIASRVSGRIERLHIKYNYQPVKKGQLIMEIYSPDLAAAQRELLFVSRSGNEENMLQGAKQRLLLLGMTERQIASVMSTGKVSYRVPVYSNTDGYILEQATSSPPSPAAATPGNSKSAGGMTDMSGSSGNAASSSGSSSPPAPILIREGQYIGAGQVIFTIYKTSGLVAEFSLDPKMASLTKRDQKLIIEGVSGTSDSFSGKIGLIQPVLNAGENFTIARVYLSNKNLRPGELVVGHFPVVTDNSLWLPREAVLAMGNRSVVFKKEGKVFVPRVVETGISSNNEVEIKTDISTWEVATNAYFMIDSESFIKFN